MNVLVTSLPCRLALVLCLLGAGNALAARSKSKSPPSETTRADQITFVAFDTETTGFSPTADRIVEIGAVKFKNGEILEEKSWLINPHMRISYWARQAHGIANDDLTNSPSFRDIYPEFAAFAKDCVLLAHNARFDVSFMREEFKRNDLAILTEGTLDTMRLFRTWWPQFGSHTIESLMNALQLEADVYHRALADTLYIVYIYKEGIKSKPQDYTLGQLVKDSSGMMFFTEE